MAWGACSLVSSKLLFVVYMLRVSQADSCGTCGTIVPPMSTAPATAVPHCTSGSPASRSAIVSLLEVAARAQALVFTFFLVCTGVALWIPLDGGPILQEHHESPAAALRVPRRGHGSLAL